jgi:hypothetical protein
MPSESRLAGFDTRSDGFNFAFLPYTFVPLQQGIPNPLSNDQKNLAMMLLQVNLFQWFLAGGPAGMIIITLFLIFLFFAAWKAPAWVKEIGLGALVFSAIWTLVGYVQMAGVLQAEPDEFSLNVIWGGMKVVFVPLIYGLIVYFISLVIRIIRKPRI